MRFHAPPIVQGFVPGALVLAVLSACVTAESYWAKEGPAASPASAPGSTENLRVAVREEFPPGSLHLEVVRVVRLAAAGPVRELEVDENVRWRLKDKLLAPVCAAGCIVLGVVGTPVGLIVAPIFELEDREPGWLMVFAGPCCAAMGVGYLASFVAFPIPMYPFTTPFDEDPRHRDFVRTGGERIGNRVVPPGEYSVQPIENMRARVLLGELGATGEVVIYFGSATAILPDGVSRPPGSRVDVEITTDGGTVILPATILPRGTDFDAGVFPPFLPAAWE